MSVKTIHLLQLVKIVCSVIRFEFEQQMGILYMIPIIIG